jgi:hypothetical protein
LNLKRKRLRRDNNILYVIVKNLLKNEKDEMQFSVLCSLCVFVNHSVVVLEEEEVVFYVRTKKRVGELVK